MADRPQADPDKARHESRENSRAVFATPQGAAWCDNYQWGKPPFRRNRQRQFR